MRRCAEQVEARVAAGLAAGADRHDAEGQVPQAASDHADVARLEDAQRQRTAGEQHDIERGTAGFRPAGSRRSLRSSAGPSAPSARAPRQAGRARARRCSRRVPRDALRPVIETGTGWQGITARHARASACFRGGSPRTASAHHQHQLAVLLQHHVGGAFDRCSGQPVRDRRQRAGRARTDRHRPAHGRAACNRRRPFLAPVHLQLRRRAAEAFEQGRTHSAGQPAAPSRFPCRRRSARPSNTSDRRVCRRRAGHSSRRRPYRAPEAPVRPAQSGHDSPRALLHQRDFSHFVRCAARIGLARGHQHRLHRTAARTVRFQFAVGVARGRSTRCCASFQPLALGPAARCAPARRWHSARDRRA